MERNVTLYPWFKFFQNLLFWQAVWFLYFQQELSAAEAILLYAVYDIATTVLEVPSGYMSDRLGRRITLIAAALTGALGAALLAVGDEFATFVLGQAALGASAAFVSGTDTSLLYESLSATDREEEVETQELRAWRFGFVGLAVSAVIGGGMALYSPVLPFAGGAAAMICALGVALALREPPHAQVSTDIMRLASLKSALTEPVLIWLFVLTVLMYGYSHIPFVFGQPFILNALDGLGLAGEAPMVSGAVSAMMMVISVVASLFALGLRRRIGLPAILLLAFGMQVVLAGVLALTNAALAIAFLFLRMVPDSLSQPFIRARIQPMLKSDSRATYLSLQSLCGRLLFAATLLVAAGGASQAGEMAYAEMKLILGGYAVAGLVCLAGLALVARHVPVEPTNPDGQGSANGPK